MKKRDMKTEKNKVEKGGKFNNLTMKWNILKNR